MWLGLVLFHKSAETDFRFSALAGLHDYPSRHLVSPRHAILLFHPRIPSDGSVCAAIRGAGAGLRGRLDLYFGVGLGFGAF